MYAARLFYKQVYFQYFVFPARLTYIEFAPSCVHLYLFQYLFYLYQILTASTFHYLIDDVFLKIYRQAYFSNSLNHAAFISSIENKQAM